jgi:hypothetical protein
MQLLKTIARKTEIKKFFHITKIANSARSVRRVAEPQRTAIQRFFLKSTGLVVVKVCKKLCGPIKNA